jgi:hypothetical protein
MEGTMGIDCLTVGDVAVVRVRGPLDLTLRAPDIVHGQVQPCVFLSTAFNVLLGRITAVVFSRSG